MKTVHFVYTLNFQLKVHFAELVITTTMKIVSFDFNRLSEQICSNNIWKPVKRNLEVSAYISNGHCS
jgi:hypothetical protein